MIAMIPHALVAAGMDLPLPEAARSYAGYMAGTFAFMMIVVLARNVFPALDCSSLPVYVLLAAVPLNGLLNAVLMYGWFALPAMGLAGAGASSLAVAMFMAALLAAYACFAPRLKACRIAHSSIAPHSFPGSVPPREMFLVGAAALCETGVFLLSTMMIGFYEMNSVASHIAVFRMVAITYVLSTGIGQAITIHAARAGNGSARLASLEWSALLVTIAAGPVMMVLVNAVPAFVVSIMGMDGARIQQLAPVAGISVFAIVPTLAIRGFLRAVSDSFAPAAMGVLGYWCVGFPAMLFLAGPAGYGACGVWAGLALGTSATAAALIAYYGWKKVRQRRDRSAEAPWLELPAPAGE
jgi:MATE family multidrug resistance protein